MLQSDPKVLNGRDVRDAMNTLKPIGTMWRENFILALATSQ